MKNYLFPQIVGIGELLWDLLPEGKKLGGAPANFVYYTSQFGLPSMIISAVGTDSLGYLTEKVLRDRGLKSQLYKSSLPTGSVDIVIDTEGIPFYNIRENVAWDDIPFDTQLRQLAHSTSVVCFGSLAQRSQSSRNTINSFLDYMPDGKGRLKIFDINLRQGYFSPEIIEQSLTRCNFLKLNHEELEALRHLLDLPAQTPEETCRRLVKIYCLKFLILTCGASGSYVFTKQGTTSFLPTPEVDVVDTVGAGDSFTGAFVASIVNGLSLEEAHSKAVEVSAYVCTQPGAACPLPREMTKLKSDK